MPNESTTTVAPRAVRIDWGNDQALFYWSMKWKVRSEDIREAATLAGPNVDKIEAWLRRKGWLR